MPDQVGHDDREVGHPEWIIFAFHLYAEVRDKGHNPRRRSDRARRWTKHHGFASGRGEATNGRFSASENTTSLPSLPFGYPLRPHSPTTDYAFTLYAGLA